MQARNKIQLILKLEPKNKYDSDFDTNEVEIKTLWCWAETGRRLQIQRARL